MYYPGDSANDSVVCPLCEYEIGEFEKQDDPWYVHLPYNRLRQPLASYMQMSMS